MKSTAETKADQAGARPLCLLRLPEVIQRVGLSRSEVYRRIADGRFPPPRKLGARVSAWSSEEVDRWIRTQLDS